MTLGATALTTVASRLGIGVAWLRPRDAIVALRTAAARYDGTLGMRRAPDPWQARLDALAEAQMGR